MLKMTEIELELIYLFCTLLVLLIQMNGFFNLLRLILSIKQAYSVYIKRRPSKPILFNEFS